MHPAHVVKKDAHVFFARSQLADGKGADGLVQNLAQLLHGEFGHIIPGHPAFRYLPGVGKCDNNRFVPVPGVVGKGIVHSNAPLRG